MSKVKIETDEQYPFYRVAKESDYVYQFSDGDEYEIDEETLKRWKSAYKEYFKVRIEIREFLFSNQNKEDE